MVRKVMPVFFVIALIVLMMGLLIIDNGERSAIENNLEVKAKVVEVDDSGIVNAGVSNIGEQTLDIEILEGKYKGQVVKAINHLSGNLEFDNLFKSGDKIIAGLLEQDGRIKAAVAVDLYRQGWQLTLFLVFVLCLIIYAGFTGLKALLSFVASLYVIWTFLIPGLLQGRNPLMVAMLVLTLLTAIIIFSIAGFTKRGVAAFAGTIFGMFATIGITMIFGTRLGLSGTTEPFAAMLLASGYFNLNLQHIFYAAIVIGASGAAMDIAMDVAASMNEIKLKRPDIRCKELIQSGLNVGRAVIGTMTTTLLLAYSGGYLTLLMIFMSKNSSFGRMINLKIVSAEIMRTVIGSIGLVLVAPITTIIAGLILSYDLRELLAKRKSNKKTAKETM